MRDRTLTVIGILAVFLLCSTPFFSSFSLRHATAVAIDYNLSVISFLGILLVLFLGINIIARDIDNRSVYTVISLPLSRGQYILGKFIGLAALLLVSILILMIFLIPGIMITQQIYPQGVIIHWDKIFLATFFIYLKLIVIGAVIFLFSSVGTSTIFPLMMGIAFYFVGESTEDVMIYFSNKSNELKAPVLKNIALGVDFLFPNLSALDLKATAIYGLPVEATDLMFVALNTVAYMGIALILTVIFFRKREFS